MRCIALNSCFLLLFICLTTFFFFVLIRCILFEVECSCSLWFPWLLHVVVLDQDLLWQANLLCHQHHHAQVGGVSVVLMMSAVGGGDRLSSVCDVLNPELTVSCIICGEKAAWACSLSSRIFNIWITWMSTDSWTSTACVKKTDRRLVHYLRLFSPSLPRLLSQNMLNSEEPRPWVPLPDVIPLDWPCALRKHTWCFLCCRFLAFI